MQTNKQAINRPTLLTKISLLTVALAIFITFVCLLTEKFNSKYNGLLFSIAFLSFIGLSVKILGDGKGNKLLSVIFWTVCLLMVVDIRVINLADESDKTTVKLRLKSETDIIPGIALENKILPKQDTGDFKKKLGSFLECYHHCEDMDIEEETFNYLDDKVQLKYHYIDVLEATRTFRPQKRRKKTIYKSYLGPRLEDHFIHNMFAEPFETFSPLIPLYIHWTEVQYSKAGGGMSKLYSVLENTLQQDVVYFSVASCETQKIQKRLSDSGFKVIFASSKGDPTAHIILPHLFRYNAPGFHPNGDAVFNDKSYAVVEADYDYSFFDDDTVFERLTGMNDYDINRANHDKVVFQREVNNIPKTSPLWRFKNYSYYFSMYEENIINLKDIEFNKTFPEYRRFSFVGSLKTHRGRRKLISSLQDHLPNQFIYKNYLHDEQCVDYSSGTGFSACWRTLMLSTGITLAPVGTAPVSYRLYEALQMGLPPIYIYDDRGAFIPYKDTEADISKLGLVASFDKVEEQLDEFNTMNTIEFDTYIRNIRKEIAKLRDTHFTPHGTMGQIKSWIQTPYNIEASDIRCCKNPIQE